jgi:hypothetical protein
MGVREGIWRGICVAICGFFLSIGAVHAQVGEEIPPLRVEPSFPQPGSTVTVSLDAYTMDTTGATVSWSVNGLEKTGDKNNRSIEITVGDVGEIVEVTARVIFTNGFSYSPTVTVVPTQTDLIIESSTYVPPFYKGRALPSGNTHIRAVAIPHLKNPVPLQDLTYEWKQGDTVLFGGPIKGKYAADIVVSRYEGDTLSVTVTDGTKKSVGKKTIFLTPSEPELHFYEENPLRGLSHKAIRSSLTLIGDETTVHAEPFFMATDLTKESSEFNWAINGESVETNPPKSHTITLRRTGGEGSATIETQVMTLTTIPQYVKGGFTIMF